jgi:hypothetical protein
MGHGAGFAQFLYDGGDRGEDQFVSIDWLMGMAYRSVGDREVRMRATSVIDTVATDMMIVHQGTAALISVGGIAHAGA